MRWIGLASAASLFLVSTLAAGADSAALPHTSPWVAIIIDDLGVRYSEGQRAVDLPGPLTYAFLPHTPYTHDLAERAHARGKEVMLHLPMQSVGGKRLGPGALRLDMTPSRLLLTLRTSLDAVPHVSGVNNHMGSLLTRHPGYMEWVMQALRCYGELYFVDSRTTASSVAAWAAGEHGVPHTSRDIFLDHVREPAAIEAQLATLVKRAHALGSAIGIGHPYPETLAVLEQHLPQLDGLGVRLVHVSQIIERQRHDTGAAPWQASLSH